MPTPSNDKRRYQRIASLNLLNYFCMDESHNFVEGGMGRTLNVSQAGILLETHVPIDPRHIISLSIGLGENLINILGRIVYSRQGRDAMFESGVHFFQVEESTAHTLLQYIHAFRRAMQQAAMTTLPSSGAEPASITGLPIDYMYVVEEERFDDNARIVEEGRFGSWIWVILEGMVEIVKKTKQGPLTLLTLGEGSFVGSIVSLLIADNVRKSTALARGRVVLGLIDSARLVQEYSQMSADLRRLVLSVDKRLNQISEQAVTISEGGPYGAFGKGCNQPGLRQGEANPNLYVILKGTAVIRHQYNSGGIALAHLAQGDYFGNVPFLDLGQEPGAAGVMASSDLKVSKVDLKALQEAFDRTSYSFQNIIQNMARCVKETAASVMRMAAAAKASDTAS
jgi:CRP-like cAMP-binding protein